MTLSRDRSSAPPHGAKYRLLFVDDEEAILSALRSLFRREGYDLLFIADPAGALALLESEPVDLIISDLRMPVISGTEFLARAAAIQPSPIRIMLSGYEDKAVVINAIAHGLAKDYIMKPWDDLAFRELITENLTLYGQLRATEMETIHGRLDAWPFPYPSVDTGAEDLSGTDVSIQDVVATVERSPALIARLLRVANSVHYGIRQPICTIREAVLFVGTEFVVSLLLALESQERQQEMGGQEGHAFIERFWQEAIRRASIARAIAGAWDEPDRRHIAFIASLFQDIGVVVRAQSDPGRLNAILQAPYAGTITAPGAPVQPIRTTDAHIGATLLRFWNFPEEIVTAIEEWHSAAEPTKLQMILRLADEVQQLSVVGASRDDASRAGQEWFERLAGELGSKATGS